MLRSNNNSAVLFSILCLCVLSGCAGRHYVFNGESPIEHAADNTPSSVPEKDEFNFKEYAISSSVRYPVIDILNPSAGGRSRDVNSSDEVPASTWFEPRLGNKELSPEDILNGPVKDGPPQKPLKVVKIKKAGSAQGFHIEDSRGIKYLIKFDTSKELPGFETTLNFIANRLYWAFGYHVPEDYIFYFSKQDLKIEGKEGALAQDLEDVLSLQTVGNNQQYRVTASRFLSGNILGNTAQRGVRQGDANDAIAHEDRRSLRALYVFGALTGNTGMRSDNTLDVYIGDANQGYTRHYLLDFGENFGVHGMNYARTWEGSEHFFSWEGLWKNALTLGLYRKPWEKIEAGAPSIRPYYESAAFNPEDWKEAWQFTPMRRAQADDHYWAVKIIARLTQEHLVRLFTEAGGISQDDQNYLIETFFKRRDMLVRHYLTQVTPLESGGVQDGRLKLIDIKNQLIKENFASSYRAEFYNERGRKISVPLDLQSQNGTLNIQLPNEFLQNSGSYLRAEISALHKSPPQPAQFHLKNIEGQAKVVGIVH